jgi:hypothetical protein
LRVPARSATPNRPSASSRRTISVRSWATRRPGPMGTSTRSHCPADTRWSGQVCASGSGTVQRITGLGSLPTYASVLRLPAFARVATKFSSEQSHYWHASGMHHAPRIELHTRVPSPLMER